jgi:hypothetical protein
VPIVALNRINGQFFAYLAEPGEAARSSRVSAPSSRAR